MLTLPAKYSKAKGKTPNSCFGLSFNFKLDCFCCECNGTVHYKNVNNYLNTNIYTHLGTKFLSIFKCSSIFSTPVLIRHLWQLKTVVFLHWYLICTVLLQWHTHARSHLDLKTLHWSYPVSLRFPL